MKVKLCGFKDQDSIQAAVANAADFIGFIFYEKSARYIDPKQAATVSKLIPKNYDIVCESGLNTNNDLNIMEKNGIMRFLVGESLMKKDNIEEATKKLLSKN